MQRQRDKDEDNQTSGSGWGTFFAIATGVGLGALLAGFVASQKEEDERNRIVQHNRTAAAAAALHEPLAITELNENDDIDFEYDSAERNAVVYLYTSVTASVTNDLPLAASAKFHHWEIVVLYDDMAFRSLDGYGDESGRMRGRYKKIQPTVFDAKIELGHVTISPRKLWQYAKNNVLNRTPYNFANNNCQNWALALAEQLGVNIFEELHKIERLPSGIVVIGGMCSALLGSFTRSSKRSSNTSKCRAK